MKNPIHIVSAKEGKIEMRLEDNTVLPLTDDPKMIALAVGCNGFARPNAARNLFEQGMAIAAAHERGAA
jgi:hypothetical protein